MPLSTIAYNGLTSPLGGSVIVSATAQASTSGTSIDFTSIPSWVKRVTVVFNGVSTNGTNAELIQFGNGSFVTSGYLGAVSNQTGGTTTNFTNGFQVNVANAAADILHTQAIFTLVSGNTWSCSFITSLSSSASVRFGSGTIALSSALDRIRITTNGGTDTFDAGTINILYE
jgi:hypothetical protein